MNNQQTNTQSASSLLQHIYETYNYNTFTRPRSVILHPFQFLEKQRNNQTQHVRVIKGNSVQIEASQT